MSLQRRLVLHIYQKKKINKHTTITTITIITTIIIKIILYILSY